MKSRFAVRPLVSAGIMLSYKCNSRCKHCLYCCSPEWREWMDVETVHAICRGTIESSREIHGFHLAGGEAFLNFPLLLESVRVVTGYAIPIDYVETNAGWFTDDDSAIGRLTQLREAGLNCLLVSASPFHAEHIPLEKTIGAVQTSMRVFGQYGTMIWLPEFLQELVDIRTEGKVAFEDYVESAGVDKAREAARYGGQLIPGGRSAFALAQFLSQRPKEAFLDGDCSHELLRSARGHFDPYGNIVPGVCSGISIGDSRDMPAAYRDFRVEDHKVLHLLCTKGVRGLLEMAQAEFGYECRPTYAGKCDLCVDIRRHLARSNAPFDELRPAQFYEQV